MKMSDITIKVELRPCFVKDMKCLFHKWSYNWMGADKVQVAIVERYDGVVLECYPHEVCFADNKINEYAFDFDFYSELKEME